MARVLVLPKRSALVRFELNPAQTIVVGFATIVLAGAFLLSLPVASAAGRPVPFLTALFTATSATCVTGRVVVDTATYFSRFGQLVIMLLTRLGGLGFVVLSDLFRPRRYTLHMRVVLTTTAVLIVLGTTLILLLESSNAATLGALPWGARLLAAFFQSVTPRTAGFNTIDTGSLR